jgi:hypothetical protein
MLLRYCVITGLNCTNEEEAKDFFKIHSKDSFTELSVAPYGMLVCPVVSRSKFSVVEPVAVSVCKQIGQFDIFDNPCIKQIITFLRAPTNELGVMNVIYCSVNRWFTVQSITYAIAVHLDHSSPHASSLHITPQNYTPYKNFLTSNVSYLSIYYYLNLNFNQKL